MAMPIPDYVAALRSAVGQDLLLLPGVTGVVVNAAGEVLLGLRSDNGRWALISGILEPGEQPAEALVREIEEETGVRAGLVGLASAWVMPVVEYPNGDTAQYLDLCFLCRHESGVPQVGDDESLEVGWFAPDALPDSLSESSRHKLERALAFDGTTWFESAIPPAAATTPTTVPLAGAPAVSVRRATRDDVPAIVELLADDRLGASREDTAELADYLAAFERIDADPAHLLVVADDGRDVVGTLQLSVIPGLSRRGALRAQVEGVRVAGSQRGRGLGEALLLWAVDEARARGCALVQLTTDKSRTDAQRFYERLGFVSSHEGMKLAL
jgi:8-oxo-dGTP pyrophosphatase MutT (NUDIX family)/ribosomal protein S18 acetylase RimI-like enzyme